jgi:hypothetical protein
MHPRIALSSADFEAGPRRSEAVSGRGKREERRSEREERGASEA